MNIHNHDLDSHDCSAIASCVRRIAADAKHSPLNMSLCLAGDFNNFDDLDSLSIVTGKACSSKASSAHSPTFWKNLTSDFVEIQGLGLSHYNAASDKLNALSRLFWLTPGWLALSATLTPHCEDLLGFTLVAFPTMLLLV